MTRTTHDPGDAMFPDGERLHEAFAEELDRPGLEGPSFDAVLRSGTVRRRRHRATTGTTFAVASVAAVATAVLATGGGTSHDISTAAGTTGTTSTTAFPASAGTTLSSSVTAPGKTSPHPGDVVLASGTVTGHSWRLVRAYAPNQSAESSDAPASSKGGAPQWCGNLNVVTDGVQTNSGNGNTPCLGPDGKPVVAADPAEPGFTSIAILDAHHDRLGTIVAGSVSPLITSVTAQCGTQSFTAKTSQPADDATAYYTFTFPAGSSCQVGSLSFFNASGSRTASLSNVLLAGGK